MKTIVYIATFLYSFYPLFCFANFDSMQSYDDQSSDTLYFIGNRGTMIDNEEGGLIYHEEIVFTGDDIKYFNLLTEELVFTDSFVSDTLVFIKKLRMYYVYDIYLSDKLLLENIISLNGGSVPINDLVFYYDTYDTYKVYLSDGYPSWKVFDVTPIEEMQKIRDENFQKRKAGWDIFIQYLSDRNKIITALENINSASPIEIYSAEKTIYVNNPSGRNGVVAVYGIDGINVAERTMAGETTTIEMPVSGFYIVSVKVENEKPLRAKVVVK